MTADLVTIEGISCLSIINYKSRFPEVLPLEDTTATGVINKLIEVFALLACPLFLVSDNSPQFIASEMDHFLKKLEFSMSRHACGILSQMEY